MTTVSLDNIGDVQESDLNSWTEHNFVVVGSSFNFNTYFPLTDSDCAINSILKSEKRFKELKIS